MFQNQIVIGTANFNQNYGFSTAKVKYNQIKKILNFCKKNKLKYFDTSRSYQDSEKILGGIINNQTEIITKIPPIELHKQFSKTEEWIKNQLNISLKNLRKKNIYGLLLHKPDILLSNKGKYIYKILTTFKRKKIIKKIGVSVYDYNLLKKILLKYKIDIAQVPFNVFDQRLMLEKDLKKKNKNLEIHCRSIFLQGLLLKKTEKLPVKLKKYKKKWYKWHKFLKEKKMKPLTGCLKFLEANKKYFNKIVIGVENTSQLREILNYRSKKVKINFSNFHIKSKDIKKPKFLSK